MSSRWLPTSRLLTRQSIHSAACCAPQWRSLSASLSLPGSHNHLKSQCVASRQMFKHTVRYEVGKALLKMSTTRVTMEGKGEE